MALGSQHGSQNPPTSTKNRRPCPSLSWDPLDIRFSLKLCSKVNKAEERRRHFAWELMLFLHFRHVEDLLKIRHDLHPKNLHFASQNLPKTNAKTAPRGYRNLCRISKRFWKVLGCENDAMLGPCWRPRCHKIPQNSISETGSQKGSKNSRKNAKNCAASRPLKPTNKARNYIRAT